MSSGLLHDAHQYTIVLIVQGCAETSDKSKGQETLTINRTVKYHPKILRVLFCACWYMHTAMLIKALGLRCPEE